MGAYEYHMSPRRILIFSLVYYPRNVGGAEIALKEITDRIPPGEVEFDMITLRKHAPAFERIGNVNVYRVGFGWHSSNTKSSKIFPLSKLLYPPLAVLKALILHRSRRYDGIWSMMASYAGFAGLDFSYAHSRLPFLLSIQEGDNFERREGILQPFFGLIFRRATHVQVISNFLSDWSRKMGATSPITVIPNAVDFRLFSEVISSERANQLKEKLNKKMGDVFLITTSRLVEKNAVSDIIRSLQNLPENIKLLILGTGIQEEYLKQLTMDLKLTERVQFLGFVDHRDMPQYLQVSDIFIRPSITEGFGNSFIEAMAAGIPVIATPVGGIVDFLKDGETGLFAQVRNPKSIADNVNKLVSDISLRNSIVEKAKKMVEEKYEWGDIADRMKKLLLEI